ncbi:MAG: sensor histidine kinase N-terminal domain-containing protein, partial [Brachymonas sp.]|nr:sensor histidine kinase N-terminal domain-containing protein [Brachymonas sp.]
MKNLRQKIESSLRYSLLRLVLLPQIIVWMLGSFAAWQIAQSYHAHERDHLMREQLVLVRQTLQGSEPPAFRLQKAAQVLGVIHSLESPIGMRYRISSPDGQVLSGDASIPMPPNEPPNGEDPLFYDTTDGSGKRHVAALSTDFTTPAAAGSYKLYLMIAQDTTLYRQRAAALARNMLLALAGLALMVSALVYLGVQRGLQPLHQLEKEIEEMQSGALHRISFAQAPAEIKAVAHALNQMLASLNKQVDGEKRFINDAAHELRTPLAGLISQA